MTTEEILKEQIQALKELLTMKDAVITELKEKIDRLQRKNRIIQDLTDIPHMCPSMWTYDPGPYSENVTSVSISPIGLTTQCTSLYEELQHKPIKPGSGRGI